MYLKCEAIAYTEREFNLVGVLSTSESGIKTKGQSKNWKMTIALKEPQCLIDQLLSYILQVCKLSKQHESQPPCITAMDEMLVWDDMVSNTTIDRVGVTSISLKMTRYEKVMVKVCLSARADGT